MTLAEPSAPPSSKRRRWGCLIWFALGLAALLGTLGYCARFECDVTSRWEFPSPDGKHIAIRLGTLCSAGFGNSSNVESVLLDTQPSGWRSESNVFVTFDTPPGVRWLDNDTLEITVKAVDAINVSRKAVKDVKVVYRMGDGLTETAIRKQLADEQRRRIEIFKNPDTAKRLNAMRNSASRLSSSGPRNTRHSNLETTRLTPPQSAARRRHIAARCNRSPAS